jgi:hypothetical protein
MPNYGETYGNSTLTMLNLIPKYFNITKQGSNSSYARGWECWNEYNGGLVGVKGVSGNGGIGYKYLNGSNAGYWVNGYFPNVCFVTPSYIFTADTYASNGQFSIDVNGPKKPNVIGKDVFVVNIKNLNKPLPGGANGFYSSSEYSCSKTASHGGVACSLEYLK